MNRLQAADVAVIGAGPAGSTAASLLAKGGLRVVLIDRATFPRDKICGDCINPACWDYFRILGAGEAIAGAAEPITQIRITGSSGRSLTLPVRARGSAPFVSLKRSTLDSILVEKAISSGVRFEPHTALEDAYFDHGWELALRDTQSGTKCNVSSSYLVGADGRNSHTFSLLSRNVGARTGIAAERVGVQWVFPRPSGIGSSLDLFFFPGGYGGMVGVSQSEANIALSVTPQLARLAASDPRKFAGRVLERIPHLVDMTGAGIMPENVTMTAPLTPRLNILRHPAAALIGDARQTMEPFTGEGILFAMQDAARCARQLSAILRSEMPMHLPAVRSSYRVNRIFAPILRDEKLREFLLSTARRLPGAAIMAARTVLR